MAGGTGWEADDRRRKWAGAVKAVPAFRWGSGMSIDDRLRKHLEDARGGDRMERLSAMLAETRATLTALQVDQERLDRRAEALRLQLVAAGLLPAEED